MTFWSQFAADPESNTSAPPVGAPEGNYRGSVVNNTFRFVMAAIRELGDTTLKISVSDGSPITSTSTAGSMALQDSAAVAITGGTVTNVIGSVPVGVCVPFSGSSPSATLTEAAALLATHGLAICDGRAVGSWTTPDLRGLFIQGWLPWQPPGTTAGDTTGFTLSSVSSSEGLHTHTGFTGLNGAHNHSGFTTGAVDAVIGNSLVRSVSGGTTVQHTHPIPTDGIHSHAVFVDGEHHHTVDITPPNYRMVWLQRVPV